MTEAAPAAGPIDATKRLALLDGVRGLALFGILIANMAIWTGYYFMGPEQRALVNNLAVSESVDFVLEWLVVGKFYGLFSLLFGIGFYMQLTRLEERGEGVARYMRRLFILLLIGLAHLLLLWLGDILALYAIMGFVLLLFRNASNRALIVWAAACWLVTIPWAVFMAYGNHSVWNWGWPLAVGVAERMGAEGFTNILGFYQGGDIANHLRGHPAEIVIRYIDLLDQMRFTKVLGLFLIGMWVGRMAIPSNPEAHRGLLKKVALWGYAIGLPMAALSAAALHGYVWDRSPEGQMARAIGYAFGVPGLAMAYGATAALAWINGRRWLLEFFAPAGRMALTNYIMQTIINSIIFIGWGFGYMGRVPFAIILVLTPIVVIIQVLYSRWWLARYRFGPLEWLWRTATYGKAQPIRLAAA